VRTTWEHAGAPQPDVVHSSLYEALRETAFKERCKIHDLVMEGINLRLKSEIIPRLTLSRQAGSND
jgi:hypothetical protein